MTARHNAPALLQPLQFPLRGSHLIEASAGTGKTFTIAALYLRLVLDHGGPEAAFGRPLNPPEILVVTFTDAATQELRDRIRARLAEAAERFLADPATVPEQPAGRDLLHDLRASYPAAQWPACARQLRLAAEWMDEAAVSTIHGWCHRMLREHAFDSDSLFTQTLETDQRELLAEVLRDHWRHFFYPLEPADVATVSAWWATPDALLLNLRGLLELAGQLPAGLAPAEALRQARAAADAALAALKRPWAGDEGWAAGLLQMLDEAVAAKKVKLPARKAWMAALRDWAEGEARLPALTDTAWKRLGAGELGSLLDHPALDALAQLRATVKALPDGRDQILAHAAHWVRERLAQEQERRAQMGFNDLLTRLDAALQGPNGPRLAALIRAQFPVALIDEFQDTDPLQYRIFDTIYRVAEDRPDTAVVLIGDPKQAIYAFRGADIHTYLAARHATAGRHHTLGTNFRSTTAMVAAVNTVFGQAEQRPGGAFGFKSADGDNPLPFLPVAAQGRRERWWLEGAEGAALTCWWVQAGEKPLGSAEHVQLMAGVAAGQVLRLLQAGQQGRAGFLTEGAALRPVRPGDIAVLVNNGNEARALRDALRACGVRSVYLSEKESVFDSAMADELQRWLAACAEPENDRLLRAALGTATLGLDWAALDRLNHDELHWEQRVLQFRSYRERWRRQGVLPMLRQLLNDFGVPGRLLAAEDERALTDLLHLAELLQQASALLDGEHALIRFLAEQRADAGEQGDARQLRLESDADLVQVVTVHKSKGLEYPLVLLPFASACRIAQPDDLPLKWHDDEGRLQVSLLPDAEALPRADAERLGEDLRKLYVALTRARHATWLGVVPVRHAERGALGHLLSAGEPFEPGQMDSLLRECFAAQPAIALRAAPSPGGGRYQAEAAAPVLAPEPPLPLPREAWWIASYSTLRIAEGGEAPAAPDEDAPLPVDSAAAATWAEAAAERPHAQTEGSDAADLAVPLAVGGLHAFPRGAGPGSFLHGLLETAGRAGFDRTLAAPQALNELIERRCTQRGWADHVPALQHWLAGWLATPLRLEALLPGIAPVRPADLGVRQVEMEFWFPAERVDTRRLDALVQRHTLGGVARAPLLPARLNGMLKGFIDLVFEHEGRYFVADYKSNALGADDAAYTPEALREAVLAHRYELQYVLYLFALHRLLRSRLPDYDYERHVGGAVYLFLRGHAAPSQGLHLERPPVALMQALDALFDATEAEAPAA